MDELKFRSLNIKLSKLCKQVKDNMCNSFLDFWNGERVDAIGNNRGKLDTYFYIKTHFGKEKYFEINHFKIRQSICEIRVSAHSFIRLLTPPPNHKSESAPVYSNLNTRSIISNVVFII
jgi:hypothetical protein